MIEEFKKFIMRGNVLDMAVGIIIGAAFGKIVTSFVNDILMPPIGLLLGRVDFSNLFLNLSSTPAATLSEARDAGLPVIAYGSFLNAVVDFLIVAFAIFLLIKQVNRLMPKKEAKAHAFAPTAVRKLQMMPRAARIAPQSSLLQRRNDTSKDAAAVGHG